jgi:hypothetical protein
MKKIWGFKLEKVFKKFFKTFETKYIIRVQLEFLSHTFCHSFQVCKLHNEVGAPSVFLR